MLARAQQTRSGRRVTAERLPDHPLLRGCQELGRGESCIVLDKGDGGAVFKVVMCPATYAFLTSPERPVGDHYPRIYANHGVIGSTSFGSPVYLVELEKLYPVPGDSVAAALAGRIQAAYLAGCRRWCHWHDDMGALALCTMTRARSDFPLDILEALERLAAFVEEFHAAPDLLNRDNLMVRADGTLVFADPVFSL